MSDDKIVGMVLLTVIAVVAILKLGGADGAALAGTCAGAIGGAITGKIMSRGSE